MRLENPAFNYDRFGHQYSGQRQTDPRIAAYVYNALGDAPTIINVGAGAGSYEPAGRYVTAVEPSAVMRAQRISKGRPPAINAKADRLPFDDGAFDAAMAMVTIHHWPDVAAGLREVRRVTRGPVVLLTFDPATLDQFWNARYFPELAAVEKRRFPTLDAIQDAFGSACDIITVPVPLDCHDGFQEAWYGRPEAFLQPEVRRAQSAWGFLPEGLEPVLVQRLADALASGEWDREYGHFRQQPFYHGALKLVVHQAA